MTFSLFWLTFISFFLNYEKPSYVNIEWCTICTITMITIVNAKIFRKRHFDGDFNKQFLKISLLVWKKSVLHTTILCTTKLDKFHLNVIYLVLTKEMAQKWHLWQELLKLTSKLWKPSYAWMTWCRQQSKDINYVVMEYLNLWPILEAWACELKALKSAR